MKENGFEYVDLGLASGTMWATCNVGATKPEDDGLLFQFGRVDGYRYGETNNKFRTNDQNEQDTGNRYMALTTSGKIYKKNEILDLEDDAAHIHMGDAWRMPTEEQLKELYNNTTHDVVTVNGVKGMLFTSKINNKRLFVPFAGYWYNGSFAAAESLANMWSSQVRPFNADCACSLSCYSSDFVNIDSSLRSYAFSVRGVFIK